MAGVPSLSCLSTSAPFTNIHYGRCPTHVGREGSDIEHLHPRFKGQTIGEKTLVPEERRLEALAPAPGSEVKGLPPAEPVEIRHQVGSLAV